MQQYWLLQHSRSVQHYPGCWVSRIHGCPTAPSPAQVTNPARSTGRDITELHTAVTELVENINRKYGRPASNYLPVHYLERHVPLHERMAFYR